MTKLFFIFCFLSTSIWAQSVNEVFNNSASLTEEQQTEAINFKHEGYIQRIIQEECAAQKGDGFAGDLKNCDINKVAESGAVISPIVDDNIGKAYALLFGGAGMLTGGGGGPTVNLKEKDANGNNKTDTDYCLYLAIGYEMLGGLIQNAMQEQGAKGTQAVKDVQLQALLTLKEAHKARETTAIIQSVVYGGVTVCYAGRMIADRNLDAKNNTMMYVKWSAATALTALFIIKARKHAIAAYMVDKVINNIPKGNECNPYTGTACFCAEPSSKEMYASQYQEVCILNQGNPDGTVTNTGCAKMTNNQMTYDAECQCKKTNTCFKGTLSTYSPSFEVGGNFTKQANTGFDLISSGTFDRAKLHDLARANAAMAKRTASKVPVQKISAPNLNANQKKSAAELAKHMPANVAALAATQQPYTPPGSAPLDGGTKSALAKLPESVKKKVEAINTSYESNGAGFEGSAAKKEGLTMPTFGEQKSNGTEVVSFAEKALEKATISHDKSTPIFEIISDRYKRTGWNKIESQELKK